MITLCVILATLMQALDTTIANVALPYMQGSVSASQDQIDWVLTSYIVAAAIMTPPTGFLASRFGLKRLFLVSVTGFTLASMLCGMAQTLTQIVLFRVLQGAFGAALVPLSQSVLFTIYPKERQGFAMALFGIGVMIGPVLGPVLGGWLTENYSWRYVFYINLPIGILGLIGMSAFLPHSPPRPAEKLDWFGFGTLSLALGALQIMLDRGEIKDWFSSGEIIIEADRRGVRVLSVLHAHLHVAKPVRQTVDVSRPQFHRRHAVRRRHRPDLLRLDGAAAALFAGVDELSRRHLGLNHGTARRGHDGFHADRRTHGWPHRHPHSARVRAGAHRVVILPNDRLDAGYFAGEDYRGHDGAGFRPWLSVRAAERGDVVDAAGAFTDRRRRPLQPVPQCRLERRHIGGERAVDPQHPNKPRRYCRECDGGKPRLRQSGGGAFLGSADGRRPHRARCRDHQPGANHRLYRRLQVPDDCDAGRASVADGVSAVRRSCNRPTCQ